MNCDKCGKPLADGEACYDCEVQSAMNRICEHASPEACDQCRDRDNCDPVFLNSPRP